MGTLNVAIVALCVLATALCAGCSEPKPTYLEALQTYNTELELLERLDVDGIATKRFTDQITAKRNAEIWFAETQGEPLTSKQIAALDAETLEDLPDRLQAEITEQVRYVDAAKRILDAARAERE